MIEPKEVAALLPLASTPAKALEVFAERAAIFERYVKAFLADGHKVSQIRPCDVQQYHFNLLAAAALRECECHRSGNLRGGCAEKSDDEKGFGGLDVAEEEEEAEEALSEAQEAFDDLARGVI